ncbi:MAG TPA: ABC transporter permease, partial [Candidatus Deferrimicrobium sp.]|nr:ABC transporter permease [Candidatus Deferrimicrobium sp.]
MTFSELFSIVFDALHLNKLRSSLTLLGVIIGVMTVVSILSVITGLNDYVMSKVINLNPDVIVFTKYGIIRSRQEFILAQKRKPITMRDMKLVKSECLSCGAVGAQGDQIANVKSGRRKLSGVPITGYTANTVTLLNIDLEAGRFFTPAEEDHSAPVAVIGYDVKDQLFPTLDPLGRTITLNGYPLSVIGLQSKLG